MVENSSLKTGKEQSAETCSPWLIALARFGFFAKGVVYLVIGILAAMTAFKIKGEAAGARGALEELFRQPFGQTLLVAVAAGLVGYALWRFAQAVFDPEGKCVGAKGFLVRIGYVVIGIIYSSLALSAVSLLLGWGGISSKDEQAPKEWTAVLLEQSYGQYLVGAIGAGFIIYAVSQFYKAYQTTFREKLETGEMSAPTNKITTLIAQIGIASRAVVFFIIGIFLLLAAWHHNPNEVRGLGGALQALEQPPFGATILGIVACGLVAYGVYMFTKSMFRRFSW